VCDTGVRVDGVSFFVSIFLAYVTPPAAIHQAEREVSEFRKFQKLSREFIQTNTQICQARPLAPEPQTEQEKKRPQRSARKSRAR